MKYLIDSNCFIEPHRRICPLDIALSFWDSIKALHIEGSVFILDKVLDEINSNSDDLAIWINKNIPSENILKFENEETIVSMKQVIAWCADSNYQDKAKTKFLDGTKADMYLVSYSLAYKENFTIVTQEVTNHYGNSEIKLPDACSNLGLICNDLPGMYRALHRTF